MEDYQVEASRAVEPRFYWAPTPPQMTARNYQFAGVEYITARKHGLIGDAPGVGKTAQCIMVGNAIEAKRTLVVCPASLRLNWEKEIWQWSTLPNVTTYPIAKASDGVSTEANYVIISYDLLRNVAIFDAIMDLRWDHLILDEAHALKDPKGNKRTRLICAPDCLPSVVGRITMASGTILPNQPIECYNAVRLLDWEAINCASLDSFREFYYDVGGGMIRGPVLEQGDNGPYWVNKLHYSDTVRNVPRNEADLQFRLRKHVMVRRLKEDVLHELPRKQYHPFPLALTSEIRAALKHPGWGQVEKLYEMDATDFDDQSIIDGEVSTARRLLGEAKVESVCKYIIELLEEGVEKVVVSAHHKTVLAVAREKLEPYGLAYMDGSTPVARRQAAVDKFQRDPACRVILGQMQVIGEGHTLTAAQDVVAIEPSWVPSHLEQFADRCHRYGQKGDYVLCHLPIVPNSLDERIVARAVEKITTIHKALDARVS